MSKAQCEPTPKDTINICIWGSNKLDGQKSIWIQQVEKMNGPGSGFRFTWIMTAEKEPAVGRLSVQDVLASLAHPPRVVYGPFESYALQIEWFQQAPGEYWCIMTHVQVSKEAAIKM
jgi:hypothetical protein